MAILAENPNSEIVKCSHCNALLSSDDFSSHKCNLELKACKRIDVVYFCDDSYKDKKLISGWGIDGVLYTFEIVPRKAIPMIIPLNRRKVTDNHGEGETDEEVPVPAVATLIRTVKLNYSYNFSEKPSGF